MKIIKGGDDEIHALHERNAHRLGASFEQVKEALKSWNVYLLEDDGKKNAVILEKDGEGHISQVGNEYVGLKRIRYALNELNITKTNVLNEYHPGHVLAKRLGFEKIHEGERITNYERKQK